MKKIDTFPLCVCIYLMSQKASGRVACSRVAVSRNLSKPLLRLVQHRQIERCSSATSLQMKQCERKKEGNERTTTPIEIRLMARLIGRVSIGDGVVRETGFFVALCQRLSLPHCLSRSQAQWAYGELFSTVFVRS